jgi:hypothetical protein
VGLQLAEGAIALGWASGWWPCWRIASVLGDKKGCVGSGAGADLLIRRRGSGACAIVAAQILGAPGLPGKTAGPLEARPAVGL